MIPGYEEKLKEFNLRLSKYSRKDIDECLDILAANKHKIHSGEKQVRIEEQKMSDTAKEIFALMREFGDAVKDLAINSGIMLSHITDIPPEQMEGGKIRRSISRDNDFQTESGDWSFASSTPLDGKNVYMIRKSGDGMIYLRDSTYIMGGDNLHVETSEDGQKRVLLNEPNYCYMISPKKFDPVVNIGIDKRTHEPTFEFTDEWVSNDEIDIGDKEQVSEVKEISDVTEVIENNQIFCDIHNQGIAWDIRKIYDGRKIDNIDEIINKALIIMKENMQKGKLRYINGEAGINIEGVFMSLVQDDSRAYTAQDAREVTGDLRKSEMEDIIQTTRREAEGKDNIQSNDYQLHE